MTLEEMLDAKDDENSQLQTRIAELESQAGVPAPCPDCGYYSLVAVPGLLLVCTFCHWQQSGTYDTSEDAYRAHAKGGE